MFAGCAMATRTKGRKRRLKRPRRIWMTAYSSSEAAQILSIAPITLRKLSAAFAAWISPAGSVIAGETWDRFYNDDDLDALRYIIILLRQNRNYTWVRERLTLEFGAGETANASRESAAAESRQPASEDAGHTAAQATELQQPPDEAAPHMAEAEVLEPDPGHSEAKPYADGSHGFETDDTSDREPHVVEAEVVEPEEQVPPDVAAMLARMAELYQELLHNKEQEIAALRQALDISELSAANERRELETLNRLAKRLDGENHA